MTLSNTNDFAKLQNGPAAVRIRRFARELTIIVPAYNEEDNLAERFKLGTSSPVGKSYD